MKAKTLQSQLYHPVDIPIHGRCKCENPFYTDVKATFSGPQGQTISIPGFYDGGNTWKTRFSPTCLGTWIYKITSDQVALDRPTGKIKCTANTNRNVHGGLRIHPDYPHHFQYEDGVPYFLMGYEADWIWALGLGDPRVAKFRNFIQTIKKNGFNHILMNVYAHDTQWCPGNTSKYDFGPPSCYAWEGTNEDPDHARMNVEFFRNYDRIMDVMYKNGVIAHIMLKVYNKQVNWPAKYSVQDDLFLKYVTARYQAYPNVVWDFLKETWRETDKQYVLNRINLVKGLDGYRRLITVHDDRVIYSTPQYAKELDFLTAQQHQEFYTHVLWERAKRPWPIINAEFGYEWGPGGEKDLTYPVGQSPEELINRAYQVAIAGGYIAYYYTNTAWDIIDHRHIPKGYKYCKIFYDFFTSIEWWKFKPIQAFYLNKSDCGCLAIPGKEYILYFPKKGENHIYLELEDRKYLQTYMNIHTGKKIRKAPQKLHGAMIPYRYGFKTPFGDGAPWVLHLKAAQ